MIGIVVAMLLLVVVAITVGVAVAVVVVRRRKAVQFSFQRMDDSNGSPSLKFSGMEKKKEPNVAAVTMDDGDSEDDDGFKIVYLGENSELDVLYKK